MQRPACLSRLIIIALGLLATGVTNAATDGATLYKRHCAACHGMTGNGGVGVPLDMRDLQAVIDDAYIRETIRHGRPGRVMPAFTQLSDADIDALVRHVRSLNVKPLPKIVTTVGKGNIERGAQRFAERCAACHGAHAEGGHGTGVTFSRPRDLAVLAPALNNPGFLAAASDLMIKKTLVHGREGTPMQSFLKQGLTSADLDDIVAYIRSFAAHAAPLPTQSVTDVPAILTRTSSFDVKETAERVKDVMTRYNLRIIRAVPFNQGMVPAKDENPNQMIIDGCDFGFLNKALAVDPRVGLFLPCRVTITRDKDKVKVMTINPKRLSTIFNNAELNDMCDEMYKLYNDLLDEAVQ